MQAVRFQIPLYKTLAQYASTTFHVKHSLYTAIMFSFASSLALPDYRNVSCETLQKPSFTEDPRIALPKYEFQGDFLPRAVQSAGSIRFALKSRPHAPDYYRKVANPSKQASFFLAAHCQHPRRFLPTRSMPSQPLPSPIFPPRFEIPPAFPSCARISDTNLY